MAGVAVALAEAFDGPPLVVTTAFAVADGEGATSVGAATVADGSGAGFGASAAVALGVGADAAGTTAEGGGGGALFALAAGGPLRANPAPMATSAAAASPM